MKSHKHLYPQVCAVGNVLAAARAAMHGKLSGSSAARFAFPSVRSWRWIFSVAMPCRVQGPAGCRERWIVKSAGRIENAPEAAGSLRKRGNAASGAIRPLNMRVALAEQNEAAVAAAIVKFGNDAAEVMRALSARPGNAARKKPEQKREVGKPVGKKESALQRFGRDLTELAAQGALPPLIGRREEMLRIRTLATAGRRW